MIESLLLRAQSLQTEIETARSELEGIRTWTVVAVRQRLRSFEGRRRGFDAKTTQLHTDMTQYLDTLQLESPSTPQSMGSILGKQIPNYFVEMSKVSRNSIQCVLAIQRLQDASSGLGAMIERKHAYTFAFISLYVGLISTIASTAIGLYGGTSTEKISERTPCVIPGK